MLNARSAILERALDENKTPLFTGWVVVLQANTSGKNMNPI